MAALTLTASMAAESAPGTWKWSFTGQNGQAFETTLKLTQDGDKLAGKISGRVGADRDIEEASIKDGTVKFTVKRERDGQTFVTKYEGKIAGNKITGKSSSDRNGEARTRDWEAVRLADVAKWGGTWTAWSTRPDGQKMESKLTLKQEGEKITGSVKRGDTETELQDAKVNGNEITFRSEREREGRKIVVKVTAKITGDSLKGQHESDFSGELRKIDWEATRDK